MTLSPLRPDDEALIAAAATQLEQYRRPKFTHVCAAVRGGDDTVHFGVEVAHRAGTVCAEPTALSAATLAGVLNVTAVVAVCYTPDLSRIVPISPCGRCREVLWAWAPEARVILPGGAVRAADLFQHGSLFGET